MNQIMFDTVERRLIREGINISIFPEGTCTSRAEGGTEDRYSSYGD